MTKIALVGNPNSGKTTVFNGLTGSNQSVGNWPGVTVERKSGVCSYEDFKAEIIDLPGIYSLSTVSLEEEIAMKYVMSHQMDYIINVVDASNLERNLFLTYQLLDSNIPVIVALNCMDLVEKKLEEIDILELQRQLNVPVIPLIASKKHGTIDLIKYIATHEVKKEVEQHFYSKEVEQTIERFKRNLPTRFEAIRFMEDGLKGIAHLSLKEDVIQELKNQYTEEAKKFELDFDMILPSERYNQIIRVCDLVLTRPDITKKSTTDKIDDILTHKFFGLPIFAFIMLTVFYLAFGPVGTFITDWFVTGINYFFAGIDYLVGLLGMATWVSSLISNGIFGGLAAVVGFLPQLMILFFFLALLEDLGYMARAAFIMDRALRRFGLSGKSFIPMLVGFGCSVPAVTATRTLDKAEDRKITSMIIPFISCGAKAPIYGVFAGALFASNSYLVVFSMYILGIFVAIMSAVLFKKTILRSASQNYIMELPTYRMPSAKNMWLHTWERSKGFLIKAGTILLGAFIIIWFLSYFGFHDGTFQLLSETQISESLLASIGRFIMPIFQPIGFNSWQSTVAILSGFVAKESVVGTLGILYGVAGDAVENGSLLYADIQANFTPLQAYSFMAFALLSTPCIATLAAMKKELGSWKWLIFSVVYELTVAYLVALAIYQLGSLGIGQILSYIFLVIVVLFVYSMIKKVIKQKGKTCSHCDGCGMSCNCSLPQKDEYLSSLEDKNDHKVR